MKFTITVSIICTLTYLATAYTIALGSQPQFDINTLAIGQLTAIIALAIVELTITSNKE
tara:strand:+ start:1559 stop:1735 length:177 start_codon:yes stop_codon:yes gene_type:complete